MKIDIKSLLFYILLPIILSFTIMILINDSISNFNNLKLPISIKRIVFIIIWIVLYILSGIAAYIIEKKDGSLNIYYIGLILNLLWIVIFFVAKNNIISLIYTIVFSFIIFINTAKFYNKSKIAGILMLPYFLWTIFSIYLVIGVMILN